MLFNKGDKVRVVRMFVDGDKAWIGQEGLVVQTCVYHAWAGVNPGYTVYIEMPDTIVKGDVFFLEEELELIKDEPFDFVGVKMYILEAQSKLANAMFLCEVGIQNTDKVFEKEYKDELKQELVCAGYCMTDVMDLFDE